MRRGIASSTSKPSPRETVSGVGGGELAFGFAGGRLATGLDAFGFVFCCSFGLGAGIFGGSTIFFSFDVLSMASLVTSFITSLGAVFFVRGARGFLSGVFVNRFVLCTVPFRRQEHRSMPAVSSRRVRSTGQPRTVPSHRPFASFLDAP